MHDATTPLSWPALAHHFQPGHALEVPASWKQGRTVYGGVSAALAVLAARAQVEGLPPLRSLQALFTGPSKRPELSARLLREGRNVSSVDTEAREGDHVVGNAQLVFGRSRDSALSIDHPAPHCAPPEVCEPFAPDGHPFIPAFFGNFEVRLAGGSRPLSGAAEGRILAWARHRDPAAWEGSPEEREAAFVCLGDVLPPAAFAAMGAPAPISSVNWMLNILRAPNTQAGWFLVESHQTAARDGYSSQRMRFWARNGDGAGSLVAEGMQSVAVFA